MPEPTEQYAGGTQRNEIRHLALVLNGRIFQQETGEDSQQTGRDRRDRAQEAFRVVECVPFLAGQVLKVEVIGQVIARAVFAGGAVGRGVKELLRPRPGGAVFDR